MKIMIILIALVLFIFAVLIIGPGSYRNEQPTAAPTSFIPTCCSPTAQPTEYQERIRTVEPPDNSEPAVGVGIDTNDGGVGPAFRIGHGNLGIGIDGHIHIMP